MQWCDVNEVDGETEQLVALVINGWCWNWPGWKWVAGRLNSEYGNNRSPSACRSKFQREEARARKAIAEGTKTANNTRMAQGASPTC